VKRSAPRCASSVPRRSRLGGGATRSVGSLFERTHAPAQLVRACYSPSYRRSMIIVLARGMSRGRSRYSGEPHVEAGLYDRSSPSRAWPRPLSVVAMPYVLGTSSFGCAPRFGGHRTLCCCGHQTLPQPRDLASTPLAALAVRGDSGAPRACSTAGGDEREIAQARECHLQCTRDGVALSVRDVDLGA